MKILPKYINFTQLKLNYQFPINNFSHHTKVAFKKVLKNHNK